MGFCAVAGPGGGPAGPVALVAKDGPDFGLEESGGGQVQYQQGWLGSPQS